MHNYFFYLSCVSWPMEDVDVPGWLSDMIEQSRDITRATFCRHVDRGSREALESRLGYDLGGDHRKGGLTCARDWHVSYHRSKLHGTTVYFMRHSAIEYVFTRRSA